jgi:hypothetical protein
MHFRAKFRQESQDPLNPAYGSRPLSSTITNVTPDAPEPEQVQAAAKPAPSRTEIWLNRIFVAIFVLVCVQMGIILVILPWTRLWTDNNFLLHNLSLREFAVQDFVRGTISGLGLLDIWIGIREGVHYREGRG